MTNDNWQLINIDSAQKLIDSRLQLHYAIQFIAATGAALAEPLPDYSHTSLVWDPNLKVFVGSTLRADRSFQVAVDPVGWTLILLDQQGETIASLPLNGKTLATGLRWLQQEISKLGADGNKVVFLDYPPDDFPDHPLAHGAAFAASQELVLNELVHYYANTQQLLEDIVASQENASAIHIWPHHFDVATLLTLPGTKNGNPLTIGVGLSPGDTSYSEPYWYVSPYPYPNPESLPPLDGHGFWHTQHWVGAVLPASRLIAPASAAAQQQQVETFLSAAVKTSLNLLQPESPIEV